MKRKKIKDKPKKKNELWGTKIFSDYYKKLDDDYIKKKIDEKIAEFKRDNNIGNYIKNKPYPTRYLDNENLFVCNITPTMRLIYTIMGKKNTIIYNLLEVLNHKEYDVLFGYHTS